MRQLKAIDLFCGAGGTTTGAEQSGFVKVKLAVNHWRTAVYSHQANHPDVRHICAEVDSVNPIEFAGQGLRVLLASPECVGHSDARGSRPINDQRRASAWCVQRWAEALRPDWIIVENVREFQSWGPLGCDNRPLKSRKGEIFGAWVQALRAINYHVEWKLLNAADFGGATSRVRLFIVARRGRSTQPIPWPVPTHTRENWTPAHTIIDWSRPCPSIFGRKTPLKPKTLARIEVGLHKFCSPEIVSPFLVKMYGTGTVGDINDPTPTITASGQHLGLAQPFIVQYHGGKSDKRNGTERQYSLLDPLPTIDTQPRYALAAPFLVPHFGERDGQSPRSHGVTAPLPTVTGQGAGSLVVPYLIDVNHGDSNGSDGGRVHPMTEPLGTVTTKRNKAMVLPFVTEYYGTGGVRSVGEPLSTCTTKPRHGLTLVEVLETMGRYGISDLGFRMLHVDELAAAQGFPAGYSLHGTQEERIKQVGNSVHTAVAEALCRAIGGAA